MGDVQRAGDGQHRCGQGEWVVGTDGVAGIVVPPRDSRRPWPRSCSVCWLTTTHGRPWAGPPRPRGADVHAGYFADRHRLLYETARHGGLDHPPARSPTGSPTRRTAAAGLRSPRFRSRRWWENAMSADSVIPGAQARRVCAVEDLEALAGSAVDTPRHRLPARVARPGDAFARRIGHEDVFHYSVYLRDQATGLTYDHVSTQPGSAGPAARRPACWGRSGGSLSSSAASRSVHDAQPAPSERGSAVVTVSGALSWIVSHVTGAMVRHDARRGTPANRRDTP